jgi:hypothetical protein
MADRFELFTRLVGGKDKLPPRLPTPPPKPVPDSNIPEKPKDIVDAFGNLQTYDDFVSSAPRSQAKTQAGRPLRHAINKLQGNGTEADSGDLTLDPRKGEPAAIGTSFCPFLAINKFPYKYVDQLFRQPVASAHFDEGKLYNRKWDL